MNKMDGDCREHRSQKCFSSTELLFEIDSALPSSGGPPYVSSTAVGLRETLQINTDIGQENGVIYTQRVIGPSSQDYMHTRTHTHTCTWSKIFPLAYF